MNNDSDEKRVQKMGLVTSPVSNPLPKQKHHKIIDNDKLNNPYIGIAHIDYVKKDTPPYYGLHETGSGSISYADFFKVK